MNCPKSMEELDEELCNYCPLPEQSKGVHCYGNSISMCEGKCCNEAYKSCLEESEED